MKTILVSVLLLAIVSCKGLADVEVTNTVVFSIDIGGTAAGDIEIGK